MASKAIGFLNFKFGADLKGFERAMNKAQKKLKKFGKNVTKAGQNLSRNLTLPILALGAASIKAFDEQAKAETKLLTALKGREDVQQRLINQAKELQKVTLFGDEATIAAQSMLAMMGLTEKEIMQLIPLIQDFATAKGMDLVTAADLVAKSMGSSTNALSRYGIEITGAVGSTERLDTAVNQLTEKFEGQAKAAALIGAGPLIMMKNQLGDLAEQLGQRLMPHVKKFTDWVVILIAKFESLTEKQKDNIVKWALIFAAIGPVLIIIGKLSIGIGALIGVFKSLFVFLAANPWIVAAAAIAAVGYALYDVFIATEKLSKSQKELNKITNDGIWLVKEETDAIEKALITARDETKSNNEREEAVKFLNEEVVEFNKTLKLSEIATDNVTIAVNKHTDSLIAQAQKAGAIEKMAKLQKELFDLEQFVPDPSMTDEAMAKFGNFMMWIQGYGDTFTDDTGADFEIFLNQEEISKVVTRIQALNKYIKEVDKSILESAKLTLLEEDKEEEEKLGGVADKLEIVSLAVQDVSLEADIMQDTLDGLKMPEDLFNTHPLDKYRGALGDLGEQMATFFGKDIKELEQITHDASMKIAGNLAQGADSWEEYGQTIKNVIRETIGALISEAVMTAALSALKGVPFPFNIIAAGVAAGAARTAFNSIIPQFADGGLVYGPTTALIGEGVGTTASNPEVVAPLDKLKQYMGGGNQNIIVEGVLKGNDIYLSNRNTSINRLRTS